MTERYISLQLLRASAAWLVVFHHYLQVYRDFEAITSLERFFRTHGNLGVDIFFVLSGFIMALSLTNRPKTARGFAVDRLVRIVPAYWVATAIFLAAIQWPVWEYIEFLTEWSWRELIYSILFIPHQHQSGIGAIPVLTVGWTLNYEMFFYALLAFSLLINARRALSITLVVVLALPIINAAGFNIGPVAGSLLLYEFVFGLLIFQLAIKSGHIHSKSLALQVGLGFGCLLIALASFWLQFYRSDMVIATALVLGCVCSEAIFCAFPKLISSIFVHLGNLSYSVYLLHVPAMIFVGTWIDHSRDNDIMLMLTSVGATYLMSWITYTLIEQRLSKALKRQFASKTV